MALPPKVKLEERRILQLRTVESVRGGARMRQHASLILPFITVRLELWPVRDGAVTRRF